MHVTCNFCNFRFVVLKISGLRFRGARFPYFFDAFGILFYRN